MKTILISGLSIICFLVISAGVTSIARAQADVPSPPSPSSPPATPMPVPDWGTNSGVGKTPGNSEEPQPVPASYVRVRMPAPIELAYTPKPESAGRTADEISYQRYKCAKALVALDRMHWQLMLSGGSAWISQEPSHRGDEGADSDGLLTLAREYINCYANLQELRGEPDANSIRDGYLESLKVEKTGPYAKFVRDDAVPESLASPERIATAPGYHGVVYAIFEKRLMTVGFDQSGNPVKKVDYDVLLHHKQVPD